MGGSKTVYLYSLLLIIGFAALLVAILFAPGVNANPQISSVNGDIKDGESIAISGVNFGMKEGFTEFLGGKSGHIEKTAEGQDYSFGNWKIADGNGTDAAMHITDQNVRSGTHAWVVNSDYNGSARYDFGSDIPEQTDIFISWWVRFSVAEEVGQWKMFRLSHHNDIQDSGTELVMFNWFDGGSDQLVVRPDRCPEGKNAVSYYGGNYPFEKDKWVRVDQYIRTSNVGQKDGYSETTLLGDGVYKSSWSNSSDEDPEHPTIYTYNSDMRYRWFIWQNYRGNGLDQLTVMLDDVYIQVGSVARVELGNASTLENSNIREIQRVKSWQNGLIEIEFNQGGFKAGDVAWLFVVDEFGHAGSGFEFKIKGDEVDDGCAG
jgi:hypothetical protein